MGLIISLLYIVSVKVMQENPICFEKILADKRIENNSLRGILIDHYF